MPLVIITPIIHPNGDRRDVLVGRLEDAYTAVHAALEALRECTPNGRNFYPEPGRMQRAETQHHARRTQLQAVADSLEAEAVQLQKET